MYNWFKGQCLKSWWRGGFSAIFARFILCFFAIFFFLKHDWFLISWWDSEFLTFLWERNNWSFFSLSRKGYSISFSGWREVFQTSFELRGPSKKCISPYAFVSKDFPLYKVADDLNADIFSFKWFLYIKTCYMLLVFVRLFLCRI